MHVLICGGAGYIGSHVLKRLRGRGYRCTVLDNLSTGHRRAVGDAPLIEADILEAAALDRAFADNDFDGVMHFCARSLVGESVERPLDYYRNNVGGTLNLVEAMLRHGVGTLVFSSTAAIFGEPVRDVIDEDHPKQPVNPYGRSKLMIENMLADIAPAHGLDSVSLRYFNAAGADPGGEIGEDHEPETHLIPNILRSLLAGRTYPLHIFGDDYDTPDGTCVRDYIHVNDLADAHILALEYMAKHPGAHFFNLGTRTGHSVMEVVKAAEKVTGRAVDYQIRPRRPGDPAVLVADSRKARRELGWIPAFDSLETIVDTAWHWHRHRQQNYIS